MVQRPYGPALPFGSTILCLASAQADLDRQYAEKGDVIIGVGYTWEYQGIKVYIQAIYKRLMTLSKASTALNSVVKLMDGYPELSTKIVTIILAEQGEGVIARIMITRSTLGVTGEVTVSLNGTTPNLAAPSSLAAYVSPTLFSNFYAHVPQSH